MTKEIIEKFKVFDLPISSSELSPEIKKRLYATLEQYGMSQSTAYLRIFSKGFDQWELMGVEYIKADFLERYKKEFLMADSVDEDGNIIEGDRGYAAVLALNSDEPGGFYAALRQARLVKTFKEEMTDLGMSHHTVYSRFSEDDWKQWELKGIKAIFTEFADSFDND